MPANVTVIYPAGSDATFDLDYYLKKHMPMVQEKWAPLGLQDWKIIQFQAGPDGSKPYSIAGILTWDSIDSIGKAIQHESGKLILSDGENFSNKSPIFLTGNIIGSA